MPRTATTRVKQRESRSGRGEQYKQMNVAEFFARNKELAGFANTTRAAYQTVRELVENALDATDVHGILPVIYIRIEFDTELESAHGNPKKFLAITVEDNGIGVPTTVIANAFGRVLYSSKYTNKQTRGMYGLGVKAAVLYGQMTAGRPVEVTSSTARSDYIYHKKLYIDIQRNEPRIVEEGQWRKTSGWHGTRVTIRLEGNWGKARSRVIEYIRRTAIVAPYAEIYFETPEGELIVFPRITRKMPPPPKEVKPHPHGVDAIQMRMIIQSSRADKLYRVLVEEFQSVGETTAKRFLIEHGFDPNMNPKLLLRDDMKDELVRLVTAMKSYTKFRNPRSDHLSPIGEELIVLGLKRLYNPEFVAAVTRRPKAYGGHSFIVEAGIAYGGEVPLSNEPLLLRYANKIPLLYGEKEGVIYKVVRNINWKIYNVSFPAPLAVLVHVASTKVPFKGVGKESISEVQEIEDEIRNAVQDVARKLRHYLSRKKREMEVRRKIVTLSKYIPEIARALAILAKPPDRWNHPSPEEEDRIKEALIKLVAKNIELPTMNGARQEDPEQLIRRVIEEVKIE